MLRHGSRITRFGLHVVACCCDCDIIWTPIYFGTLYTPILHFILLMLHIYTDTTYTVGRSTRNLRGRLSSSARVLGSFYYLHLHTLFLVH